MWLNYFQKLPIVSFKHSSKSSEPFLTNQPYSRNSSHYHKSNNWNNLCRVPLCREFVWLLDFRTICFSSKNLWDDDRAIYIYISKLRALVAIMKQETALLYVVYTAASNFNLHVRFRCANRTNWQVCVCALTLMPQLKRY